MTVATEGRLRDMRATSLLPPEFHGSPAALRKLSAAAGVAAGERVRAAREVRAIEQRDRGAGLTSELKLRLAEAQEAAAEAEQEALRALEAEASWIARHLDELVERQRVAVEGGEARIAKLVNELHEVFTTLELDADVGREFESFGGLWRWNLGAPKDQAHRRASAEESISRGLRPSQVRINRWDLLAGIGLAVERIVKGPR